MSILELSNQMKETQKKLDNVQSKIQAMKENRQAFAAGLFARWQIMHSTV